MKTHALRLYGKNDLRLEAFELPPIEADELRVSVVTNSICMSDHKASGQGSDHKRVPNDVATKPIIIGHEFSGSILEVGAKYKNRFEAGQKYSLQPAIYYPGREFEAPGYSFQYAGGQATANNVPKEVLEMDCLVPYAGEGFFKASLSEPISCIIGAFKTNYHQELGGYAHSMGAKARGAMAILAGAGPMGLATIDYAVHGPLQPSLLVVTDIVQSRLTWAAEVLSPAEALRCGVELHYVNTSAGNPVEELLTLSRGKGYDDVFVYAAVEELVAQGSKILAQCGCLNFFAGPIAKDFNASVNFYDVHYSGHRIVGSSGGNRDDMEDALALMAAGVINPAVLITHVGGIDSAAETTLNLPSIPGGKKLIYTHKSMPLTALEDFEELGRRDPFFRDLAEIISKSKGLWSVEAENYLLRKAEEIK
jgi:threonine dehydrogenase-like Zn-dependent dehydrogenase